MGCCCMKHEEAPKAASKRDRQCCVCNPFDQDGFLLTAQISSIIAACISWVWWPAFVLAAPIVVILQTAWCCKMSKCGLAAAGILSALAFGCSLFAAIWMATECWERIFVVLEGNTDDYYYYDYYNNEICNIYTAGSPGAWTAVAFVDAALFLVAAMSTMYFVGYRYDSILAKKQGQQQQEADEVVETGINVQAVEMTDASQSHYMAPEATASVLAPDTKDVDHQV